MGNPGIKLSDRTINEMKRMWMSGENANVIATQLGVSRDSVKRYCNGLPQQKIKSLSNSERYQLLKGWS